MDCPSCPAFSITYNVLGYKTPTFTVAVIGESVQNMAVRLARGFLDDLGINVISSHPSITRGVSLLSMPDAGIFKLGTMAYFDRPTDWVLAGRREWN